SFETRIGYACCITREGELPHLPATFAVPAPRTTPAGHQRASPDRAIASADEARYPRIPSRQPFSLDFRGTHGTGEDIDSATQRRRAYFRLPSTRRDPGTRCHRVAQPPVHLGHAGNIPRLRDSLRRAGTPGRAHPGPATSITAHHE